MSLLLSFPLDKEIFCTKGIFIFAKQKPSCIFKVIVWRVLGFLCLFFFFLPSLSLSLSLSHTHTHTHTHTRFQRFQKGIFIRSSGSKCQLWLFVFPERNHCRKKMSWSQTQYIETGTLFLSNHRDSYMFYILIQ